MFIPKFFLPVFLGFLVLLRNFFEKVSHRLRFDGSVTAKETEARLLVNLYVGDARAILPPIVLLLHQNVHLGHGIGGAIFLDVIRKGLAQTNEGNAALVKDGVAHNNGALGLGPWGMELRRFPKAQCPSPKLNTKLALLV